MLGEAEQDNSQSAHMLILDATLIFDTVPGPTRH